MGWWSNQNALAPDVAMAYAPFPADRQALPILQPLYRRATATAFVAKSEMKLLVQIDNAIDLEQLLGRRSCEILRGGYKIELEGATNPHLYTPRHARWIVEHLRSVMRRGGEQGEA
jgi:hypothetical protein